MRAEQTGRQKSSRSLESSFFHQAWEVLSSPNDQLKPDWKPGAKTCYDWGESAWRVLARSPSFSREIQAAKMFKSPARTPDLICFYSSRDCLVVVSLYHTQSWPFPPVEREASQRKRAGTASSLRDSLLLPPLLHGGPDVRTRDRTWAEPGKEPQLWFSPRHYGLTLQPLPSLLPEPPRIHMEDGNNHRPSQDWGEDVGAEESHWRST